MASSLALTREEYLENEILPPKLLVFQFQEYGPNHPVASEIPLAPGNRRVHDVRRRIGKLVRENLAVLAKKTRSTALIQFIREKIAAFGPSCPRARKATNLEIGKT